MVGWGWAWGEGWGGVGAGVLGYFKYWFNHILFFNKVIMGLWLGKLGFWGWAWAFYKKGCFKKYIENLWEFSL